MTDELRLERERVSRLLEEALEEATSRSYGSFESLLAVRGAIARLRHRYEEGAPK